MLNSNSEIVTKLLETGVQPEPPVLCITPTDLSVLYKIANDYPEGVTVFFAPGEYLISQTILLPSNTSMIGAGRARTKLILARASHCHLFTNADHVRGNRSILLRGFSVDGNGDTQERQPHHKALTFCCAIYIKNAHDVMVEEANFIDIRQTAVHFNGSDRITVRDCNMHKLGWSGVSTSNASNMYIDIIVSDAGRDKMHSAVHLDGGIGVRCRAHVKDTTGNGIMLDSAYGALRNVVVEGSAKNCKRGVSLSGSAEKALEFVLISGKFSENNETGVMISNASNVILTNCEITNNAQYGVLFQGRAGGRNCIVHMSTISDNGEDIKELHASHGNWVFTNDASLDREISANERALQSHGVKR
ncbi:right-handed parallel beta-helix repeat-containing protein [Erythrobacter sp. R86502]|uniref:right-handed parallel beta-helix repeat-containing protein n=1 Tax=Erythrobacter sp. R86502 TaxID=3093846 RepID=UPI0036D21F62